MKNNYTCPVCGNTIEQETPACPHCGFKLLGSTQKFAPMPVNDQAFTATTKPMAQAALQVVRGPQTGAILRLSNQVQTVGRSPQCAIFLNDMTVSREHAIVEPSAGGYLIKDLSSFNGVWINNKNVEQPQKLENGDIIQIGAFCLRYQEE